MIVHWNIIVIAVCALLAILLIWLEVKRDNKARLIWRALAVVLATGMLACIALSLQYDSVQTTNAGTTVLLTDGFNADSVSFAPGKNVFTLDSAIHAAHPKAILLGGAGELSDSVKGKGLDIYGHGLAAYELEQLKDVAVTYYAVPAAEGVSHINWAPVINVGEELRVQGQFSNFTGKRQRLILKGLNTVLDTISINRKGTSTFELSTVPKSTGRQLYYLLSIEGGDTSAIGAIPVQVQPVKPLKVLMLSASPDFETRFLKDWLGRHGYAVAARAAISKDKFSSDYINLQQFSLDKLSPATLSKFDVLLGDLSVLASLTPAESAALQREVGENGLGVIVRADSSGKASWLQKGFLLVGPPGKESSSWLSIDGKRTASAKLKSGSAYVITGADARPLVTGAQGRTVTATGIYGAGKIVFNTLTTFSWALDGNNADYNRFWSALISNAARRKTDTSAIAEPAQMPFADQPVDIVAESASLNPVTINGNKAAALQDAAVPFRQHAVIWPRAKGWQQSGNNRWYVYGKEDWKGVRYAENTAATRRYAALHPPEKIVTKQIQQKIRIDVPKIYFYMLLLAACTFLWIENKLS